VDKEVTSRESALSSREGAADHLLTGRTLEETEEGTEEVSAIPQDQEVVEEDLEAEVEVSVPDTTLSEDMEENNLKKIKLIKLQT
jgi:hypothetical protein